jgi:hypothetical protein
VPELEDVNCVVASRVSFDPLIDLSI